MKEFGECEEIRINDYYERIYKTLDDTSERLYEATRRVGATTTESIPLRTNYLKTKKDYLDMVLGIIEETNAEVGWCTMLAVLAGTKMFVRRYKVRNPLFASMLCLEMWIVFNKLSLLWNCPTNSHRVRLEERHVSSLMQVEGSL